MDAEQSEVRFLITEGCKVVYDSVRLAIWMKKNDIDPWIFLLRLPASEEDAMRILEETCARAAAVGERAALFVTQSLKEFRNAPTGEGGRVRSGGGPRRDPGPADSEPSKEGAPSGDDADRR
jgi:hypothetical protein